MGSHQTSYNPDFYTFFFPKLKTFLKFETINDIKMVALTWLNSQDSQLFRDCVNGKYYCLRKCLDADSWGE